MAGTTWNPLDQINATLSGGNLTATAGAPNGGVRTVATYNTGKFYWEINTIKWVSSASGIGIANAAAALASVGNSVSNACLVYPNGQIWLNGSPSVSIGGGAPPVPGVICIALDVGGKLIWFRNGAAGTWNNNAGNNPATGTGGISVSAIASAGYLYPLFAWTTTFSPAESLTANFGDSAFAGGVPSGFTAGFPAASTTAPGSNAAVSINTG